MKKAIFYAKDHKTGKNISFTLDDLYGYEGEVCGVIIKGTGTILSYNSGYSFDGMNPQLEIYDIEIVEE